MNAELNATTMNAESASEAVATATAEPAAAAPSSAAEAVAADTDARTCEEPHGPPQDPAPPADDHEPPPAQAAAVLATDDALHPFREWASACLAEADAIYPEDWERATKATFVGHCRKLVHGTDAESVCSQAIAGMLKNKKGTGEAKSLLVEFETSAERPPTELEVRKVAIDQIVVPEGRRPLDRASVNRLAVNIDEVGLLHPVVLTKDFRLVAGRKRLAACKDLGWEAVPATILAADDELVLKLAEHSENLFGTNLSKLGRIEATAGYVHTLEALGEKQKSGRRKNHAESARFPETMDEIAEDLGMAKRTVQEYVRISDRLCPEVKELVRAGKLTDGVTVLLELAKVTDTAIQLAAANDMPDLNVSIGTAKKVIARHSTPVREDGDAGSAGDPVGHTEEAPHLPEPADATASLSFKVAFKLIVIRP